MTDGCGPIRLFFVIILPLMKPVLITAGVLVAQKYIVGGQTAGAVKG